MTKSELAKAQGCKEFDTALPQRWLDQTTANARDGLRRIRPTTDDDLDNIYTAILYGTVWSYDNDTFGKALPLTDKAKYYLTLGKAL